MESMAVEKTDFIRQRIQKDLDQGVLDSGVITRFPPEPNGYLHIGHAKSICLNFGVAKEFGGKTFLRFDDTNPLKESEEYVAAIQADIEWLGFQWSDITFASNHFEEIYQYAVDLISEGKAYVCSLSPEEIRVTRGTLKEPGVDSPFRARPVAESIDLFKRMRGGDLSIDLEPENTIGLEPNGYLIRLTANGESSTETTTASINFLDLNRLSYAVFSGLGEKGITENHQIFDFSSLSNQIVASELITKSSDSVMIESTVDSVMHRLTYSKLGILERSDFGSQYSIQKSSEREVIQSLSDRDFAADSKAFPKILLDRMLSDTSNLKGLSLKLDSVTAGHKIFWDTLPISLSSHARDHRKNSSAERRQLPMNQTATFLTRHPTIVSVLERFQRREHDIDNVSALIALIHELVEYKDIPNSQGVLETLDSGRGDCTEFADLFTTLARSIGIPTQTVFGIVYEQGEVPKMAFHAWNEIQINKKFLEIDPTWQQIPADGTHIKLSQNTISSFQNYPEEAINYSVDYAVY